MIALDRLNEYFVLLLDGLELRNLHWDAKSIELNFLIEQY